MPPFPQFEIGYIRYPQIEIGYGNPLPQIKIILLYPIKIV